MSINMQDLLVPSRNLLDESTRVNGFMGSTGTITPSGSYFLSDYIPVIAGNSYSLGSRSMNIGCRFLAAFDSSKVIVPSASSDSETPLFVCPAGVSFIRVTWPVTLNTCQVEQGATRTKYVPFGCDVIYGGAFTAKKTKSPLEGINWLTYGDSLVAQQIWQSPAASLLDCEKVFSGVGGSTISGPDGSTTAMCQTSRINALSTNVKIVTVLGGTNDWAQNVPIGAIGDSDPAASFYGGLNRLFLNLCTKYQTTPITICTIPYGEFLAFAVRGWANGFTNNAGATPRDYSEAIRQCAKKWSIPVIDLESDCGINETNKTIYMLNDGNYIHPNTVGGGRMGSVAAGRLLSLFSFGVGY